MTLPDGRQIQVQLPPPPVQPGTEVVVKGEGMPISKEPGKKGVSALTCICCSHT